ncbi:MAG: histidine--tRNA ligase, partial [Acidobacteriia bacterium]|nr:histidine--tRNA ligase [Terriglobia bacterium]
LWDEESASETLALAHQLRREGLRVEIYPEFDKLGKQFKYASSRGVPFIAVIGTEERARHEITLKDLRSGEQQTVRREAVAAAVRAKLDGSRA